ncbi:CLUMA_CG011692, isoform A [Clunio marinus]|uniref:CLUMA_CG011692, isoform A n=1 Tax=Clunio marinus TaxID=568069 RepID=A0A1J1IEY8_9DIPT|nr:CLUMA_CG011692, isoform A [Clunio marinus]
MKKNEMNNPHKLSSRCTKMLHRTRQNSFMIDTFSSASPRDATNYSSFPICEGFIKEKKSNNVTSPGTIISVN